MSLLKKISVLIRKNKCMNLIKNKYIKFVKSYKKNICKNKIKFAINEMIFVMIITFVFGMLIGGVVMYGKGTLNKVTADSLKEFVDTYQDIINSYYKDIDSEQLLQAGIKGMIGYLGDPYSTYMNSEVADKFDEDVEGEYSGIGAEIIYNLEEKTVSFGKIFENSPASKVDLQTGDVLLEIEGESVSGLTTSQIADKVKGKTGTFVLIKYKRNDIEKEVKIKREKVDIESVSTKVYEENGKKIGYIGISIFAANTFKQFENKLLNLEKDGFDSLIIDVRNNSGGYLTTVTDIISLFTKKGSCIYQLNTKGKNEKIKDKTKEKREYPIYVLTNENSASASEVLAAAIKENYKGIIVGTKTFGKGKVQKAYDLSNGAKIKYTFQEWLTPNGNSIDGVGVVPDIVIENIIDATKNDNQLTDVLKAITK